MSNGDDGDDGYSEYEFTSSSPGRRWPAGFDSWPERERRHYVARYVEKKDIIRRCLLLSGFEPGRIGPAHQLRKDELAAIYLTLKDATKEVRR